MSKEQEQEQEIQQPAAEAASTASGASAPENTNTVILRANSREEIDQQFQELKAKHDGQTLTAGAVARSKDDGTYILRIDII